MDKKQVNKPLFIAYFRASTQKQEDSGLGLEAQRDAVLKHIQSTGGKLLRVYTEVESGTGSDALRKRPQLQQALEQCKKLGAVLVIAKLDRLGRNVHFLSGLMEAGARFVACDIPEANEFTIHVMAAFAQQESRRISERTREALAAAKARGTRLGRAGWKNLRPYVAKRKEQADAFAARLAGQMEGFRLRSLTQRQMAEELNSIGIRAPLGGTWRLLQVQRTLARIKKQSRKASSSRATL
jgi:DNA invertase Pin-like site-specific DNA recombinase